MFVLRPGIWEAWGRQGNRKCVILGAGGDLGSRVEAGESKIVGFLRFFKTLVWTQVWTLAENDEKQLVFLGF